LFGNQSTDAALYRARHGVVSHWILFQFLEARLSYLAGLLLLEHRLCNRVGQSAGTGSVPLSWLGSASTHTPRARRRAADHRQASVTGLLLFGTFGARQSWRPASRFASLLGWLGLVSPLRREDAEPQKPPANVCPGLIYLSRKGAVDASLAKLGSPHDLRHRKPI
jgi:hypothetical protein